MRRDAEVFLTDVPRGTFIRGPRARCVGRCAGVDGRAGVQPVDAPVLSPDRHEIVVHVEAEVLANGGAGRCEIEHRHGHRGGDRPQTVLRRRHRPRRRWSERRAAECREAHPQHSTRYARTCEPRPRVPLPRLSRHPTAARPPRPALGDGGETRSTTLSCSARPTIAFTRAASMSSAATTARSASPTPTGWPSVPSGDRKPPHPTPSSCGTNPSASPSTARPPPRTGMASASTTTR